MPLKGAKEDTMNGNRALLGCIIFMMSFCAGGGGLQAQTAAEMDVLLETGKANFGQASYFVLSAAGTVENDGAASAFAAARERGWLPKKAGPDSPIRLGELCFLVMRAFGIRGSFLYALFPGPRYAFRELDYLRLIPGRRDPALWVSGEELLRILDLVTAVEGADWITEPLPPDREAAIAESAAPPETATAVETPVPEAPAPEPAVVIYPAEPPALPESVSAATAEREQIAGVIRAEPEEHEAANTSVRAAEDEGVISLSNIQFMPDSVKLTAGEMAKLREIAAILARYPGRKILVRGHAALAGTREGRLRISTRRAQAVADFLTALNVRRAEEIIVVGYGADRPLEDTATEADRAVNRRVEIILLDEEGILNLNNIQFMPDSVELTAGEMAKLEEIAAILSRYPGTNILVGGHTALAGTREGQLQVSTRRAQAVADFLTALNVRRAEEIIVVGYGADRPLGDTATEAGRAMNRRVEIILLDKGQP
jgi:outer membrane protein OmpA-like peptidoglycan-associated protein